MNFKNQKHQTLVDETQRDTKYQITSTENGGSSLITVTNTQDKTTVISKALTGGKTSAVLNKRAEAQNRLTDPNAWRSIPEFKLTDQVRKELNNGQMLDQNAVAAQINQDYQTQAKIAGIAHSQSTPISPLGISSIARMFKPVGNNHINIGDGCEYDYLSFTNEYELAQIRYTNNVPGQLQAEIKLNEAANYKNYNQNKEYLRPGIYLDNNAIVSYIDDANGAPDYDQTDLIDIEHTLSYNKGDTIVVEPVYGDQDGIENILSKIPVQEARFVSLANRAQVGIMTRLADLPQSFDFIIYRAFMIYFRLVEAQVLNKCIKLELSEADINQHVYSVNADGSAQCFTRDNLNNIDCIIDTNYMQKEVLDLLLLCMSRQKTTVMMHSQGNPARVIRSFIGAFNVQRLGIGLSISVEQHQLPRNLMGEQCIGFGMRQGDMKLDSFTHIISKLAQFLRVKQSSVTTIYQKTLAMCCFQELRGSFNTVTLDICKPIGWLRHTPQGREDEQLVNYQYMPATPLYLSMCIIYHLNKEILRQDISISGLLDLTTYASRRVILNGPVAHSSLAVTQAIEPGYLSVLIERAKQHYVIQMDSSNEYAYNDKLIDTHCIGPGYTSYDNKGLFGTFLQRLLTVGDHDQVKLTLHYQPSIFLVSLIPELDTNSIWGQCIEQIYDSVAMDNYQGNSIPQLMLRETRLDGEGFSESQYKMDVANDIRIYYLSLKMIRNFEAEQGSAMPFRSVDNFVQEQYLSLKQCGDERTLNVPSFYCSVNNQYGMVSSLKVVQIGFNPLRFTPFRDESSLRLQYKPREYDYNDGDFTKIEIEEQYIHDTKKESYYSHPNITQPVQRYTHANDPMFIQIGNDLSFKEGINDGDQDRADDAHADRTQKEVANLANQDVDFEHFDAFQADVAVANAGHERKEAYDIRFPNDAEKSENPVVGSVYEQGSRIDLVKNIVSNTFSQLLQNQLATQILNGNVEEPATIVARMILTELETSKMLTAHLGRVYERQVLTADTDLQFAANGAMDTLKEITSIMVAELDNIKMGPITDSMCFKPFFIEYFNQQQQYFDTTGTWHKYEQRGLRKKSVNMLDAQMQEDVGAYFAEEVARDEDDMITAQDDDICLVDASGLTYGKNQCLPAAYALVDRLVARDGKNRHSIVQESGMNHRIVNKYNQKLNYITHVRHDGKQAYMPILDNPVVVFDKSSMNAEGEISKLGFRLISANHDGNAVFGKNTATDEITLQDIVLQVRSGQPLLTQVEDHTYVMCMGSQLNLINKKWHRQLECLVINDGLQLYLTKDKAFQTVPTTNVAHLIHYSKDRKILTGQYLDGTLQTNVRALDNLDDYKVGSHYFPDQIHSNSEVIDYINMAKVIAADEKSLLNTTPTQIAEYGSKPLFQGSSSRHESYLGWVVQHSLHYNKLGLIIYGFPGSGKSWLYDKLKKDLPNLVILDTDIISTEHGHPKYQQFYYGLEGGVYVKYDYDDDKPSVTSSANIIITNFNDFTSTEPPYVYQNQFWDQYSQIETITINITPSYHKIKSRWLDRIKNGTNGGLTMEKVDSWWHNGLTNLLLEDNPNEMEINELVGNFLVNALTRPDVAKYLKSNKVDALQTITEEEL